MNDRECLVTLFDAWGGKAWWRCKDYWKSEEPLGKWYGVQRDAGGHVLCLSLTDNTVTGQLGDATIKWQRVMVNLISLHLMKNNLKGSIPNQFFQSLKSLEELNLAWNQLEGSLPDSIWELSKLRILRLDNNRLSGVVDEKLGQLSQLKQLNLSRNEFSGLFPRVGDQLTSLQVLDLFGNKFDGWVPSTAREYRLGIVHPRLTINTDNESESESERAGFAKLALQSPLSPAAAQSVAFKQALAPTSPYKPTSGFTFPDNPPNHHYGQERS